MANRKHTPSDQAAEQANLDANIRHIRRKSKEWRSYADFGTKTGLGEHVVEHISTGRTPINERHSAAIERAFGLRRGTLKMNPKDFGVYFASPLTEISLVQPKALASSWNETANFAEKLKALTPVFLYYWSHKDRAIIGNKCSFAFSQEAGLQFSFKNPEHESREPGAAKKRIEHTFSGRLNVVGPGITFEVFSNERIPEPASGVGYLPGAPNALGITQGLIVGFHTEDDTRKSIGHFRFILISKPAVHLRKTDRICLSGLSYELSKYFAGELRRHPQCACHPEGCP